MNKFFDRQFKDSESQKEAFEIFSKRMKERLNHRQDPIDKIGKLLRYSATPLTRELVPGFEAGCRRVTPISTI